MQESLSTVAKLDDFVPADHPLRPLRELVDEALKRLNGRFSLIYADTGRASIAPEKLVRALPERQLRTTAKCAGFTSEIIVNQVAIAGLQ